VTARWLSACHWSEFALIGIAFNLIVLVAAPLARPDLDLLERALSYYAIGPWGVLQAAAFIAMGIASIALGIAVLKAGSPSPWMRAAVPMLIVGGLGSLGLVVYPMGEPSWATFIGDAHQTAGTIGGAAQLVAALAFILAIHDDPTWRDRVWPYTVAFAVAVIGAVLTQVAIWWPELGIPMGAVMRLAVVPLVVLWGLVALRLRHRCRRPIIQSAAAR
jgi:hypothetical protein